MQIVTPRREDWESLQGEERRAMLEKTDYLSVLRILSKTGISHHVIQSNTPTILLAGTTLEFDENYKFRHQECYYISENSELE